MAARRQALRLAARALEQQLNRDTSDDAGSELPCPCGDSARFHAKEHLGTVGKAIFSNPQAAKPWIERRYEELDQGRLHCLVEALAPYAEEYQEARECIGYIWNNRRRMRYAKFRRQGLCTSTGVVEAGCKVAIGTRLKRAGMHWTVKGANAIIALRCNQLSGRFEDFWERRSDRMKAAA